MRGKIWEKRVLWVGTLDGFKTAGGTRVFRSWETCSVRQCVHGVWVGMCAHVWGWGGLLSFDVWSNGSYTPCSCRDYTKSCHAPSIYGLLLGNGLKRQTETRNPNFYFAFCPESWWQPQTESLTNLVLPALVFS